MVSREDTAKAFELIEISKTLPGAKAYQLINIINAGYQHLQGNARPIVRVAQALRDPETHLRTFNTDAREIGDRVLLELERFFMNYATTASSFLEASGAQVKRMYREDPRWKPLQGIMARFGNEDVVCYIDWLRDQIMHSDRLLCLTNMHWTPSSFNATLTLSQKQLQNLMASDRHKRSQAVRSYVERNLPLEEVVNRHLDRVESLIAVLAQELNTRFASELSEYAAVRERIRKLLNLGAD